MNSTMKKSEIQTAMKNNVLSKLNLEALGGIQIDSSMWALPAGELDGKTVYAKVAVTATNVIGTEKVPAFDIDEAVDKFDAKKAESAEKAAERQRKHDEKVQADKERRAKRAAEKVEREAAKTE